MESDVFILIMENLANTTVIFTMIIAVITGFFGYKLQRVFSALSGFAIGAVLGALITIIVFPKNEYFLTVLLIAAIGLGITGAFLSFKFYKAGVFFYMFSTTFSMVYCLLGAIIEKIGVAAQDDVSLLTSNIFNGNLSNVNWGIVAVSLAVAIIVGIITIRYIRSFMIATTAISGGINFSTALLVDMIRFNNLFVILLVAAAFAVLGMTFQFRTTKKGR